ncbi:MAG: hypothetical protein HRT69_09735 [Flavobacteriaceae bacterium]|nr:hypothetical protein [Flavobacteriaceae bacterium]
MKTILNKLKATSLGLIALSLGFTSCQEDESLQKANNRPVVTIESNNITVTEGQDAVFALNLSEAINHPVEYRIEVIGGTAVEGVDFNMSNFSAGDFYYGAYGYASAVSAHSTTQNFSITTIADVLPEDTKTIELKFSPYQKMAGTIENLFLTVNIENLVSDDLTTTLNWSGDYLGATDVCDAATGLDFDLELYASAGGAPVKTSYGDCPEAITITGTDADDTYDIDASLWQSNGNTSGTITNIPVSITFTKVGFFSETIDLSTTFPLADNGLNEGNNNAIKTFSIVKLGTIYTINDGATQVATGKYAN